MNVSLGDSATQGFSEFKLHWFSLATNNGQKTGVMWPELGQFSFPIGGS